MVPETGLILETTVDSPLLDKTPDHAQRVVQTPLTLLQDQRVGTCANDRDCLPRILHPCDLDDLCPGETRLLDELGRTQLVLGKGLDVRDGPAPRRLCNEVDLVPLNVLDDHDLELGEEVQGQVGDGVSEDGLLDKEDVAAGLLDSLAQVEEVLSLLFEDLVHLSVIVHDDLVVHLAKVSAHGTRHRHTPGREAGRKHLNRPTHVGLGRAQLELDQSDLGLLHPRRSARTGDDTLVECQTLDELGVVDGASDLLHDPDVSQVDVGRGGCDETGDRGDGNGGEGGGVLRNDLERSAIVHFRRGTSVIENMSLTFEFKDVPAARNRLSRSFKSTGVLMSSRNSTAFVAAFWKACAIVVG